MNGCRVVRTVTLAAGVCVGLVWTGCPVSLTGGSVGVVVDPAASKTVRFAATEMSNLLVRPLISEAYGTAWFDDIRLEELPAEER